MTSPSKNKGNTGERIICKFLTEQFGGKFIRVPASGGYLGGSNSSRKVDANQERIFQADIIPPEFLPKLRVESKFYADFTFHKLLNQEPIIQLDAWIKQASIPGTLWFLVMRFNRKGSFILFPFDLPFIVGNHAKYFGYTITSFEEFIIANKEKIKELAS